jgi:hypothetical protein
MLSLKLKAKRPKLLFQHIINEQLKLFALDFLLWAIGLKAGRLKS